MFISDKISHCIISLPNWMKPIFFVIVANCNLFILNMYVDFPAEVTALYMIGWLYTT